MAAETATTTSADYSADNKYIGTSLIAAFISLMLVALFGLLQVVQRAPDVDLISANLYYLSLSAHGVLVIVFTTFFIMGLSIYVVTRTLGVSMASNGLNLLAYAMAIAGTAMAAVVILLGKASVLYTFYPPMEATPIFYIGLTLVVIGTWVFSVNVFLTARKWYKRGNEGKKLPLATYGVVATLVIWILATIGVASEMLLQLIPWSLGLVDRIDPLMARNLFWYFGHPLVYFWLLPAYIVWYTVLPRILGVPLFSEKLGRLVFTLFILFSVPVGFHHQFMDPGIPAAWKYLHTVLTFFVFIPSLMTAFTITATMEYAARRKGGKGLFGWIGKLPWNDPVFAAIALSMIGFGFGGMGGAINAGFSLNAVVHNTAWIPGHLHLTVGTATALTFMGISYKVVPLLAGRKPVRKSLALTQIYAWFVGVAIFSTAMHIVGILGSPRRSYDVTSLVTPGAANWDAYMLVSAIGGVIMFFSITLFIVNMLTSLRNERVEKQPEPLVPVLDTGPRGALDNLKIWVPVAILLVLLAYALPTRHIFHMDTPGAPPVSKLTIPSD